MFLLTAVPASGHFPSLSVQPSTPLKSSNPPRPIHLCPVIQTSTLSSGSPPSLTMTHHSHSLLRKAAERAPDLESEDWTDFLVLTPAEMRIFSPGEQLNCSQDFLRNPMRCLCNHCVTTKPSKGVGPSTTCLIPPKQATPSNPLPHADAIQYHH